MHKNCFLFLFIVNTVLLAQKKDSLGLLKKGYENFIGFGAGINAHTGFVGASSELKLYKLVFMRFGAGYGIWGPKVSGGFKIQDIRKNGFSFGVHYNYSFGVKSVNRNLGIQSKTPNVFGLPGTYSTYELRLLPASSLNIALTYNLRMNNGKAKYYVELSYGYRFEKTPYKIIDRPLSDLVELTNRSKTEMRITQPGGIGFAFGYLFGI